jgi:hypothetical protein
MASVLMIVARDQHVLFEHLREEFARETTVTVVLDRRFGERRHDRRPVTVDQRRSDRRQNHLGDQLRTLGYAVVRTG